MPEDNGWKITLSHSFRIWTFATLTPTAAYGVISGVMTRSDSTPVEGAVVSLNGAQNRKKITDAHGNYKFDNVDTGGLTKYDRGLTADAFVEAMISSVRSSNDGVDLSSERANLLNAYSSGTTAIESRAVVVKAIADNAALKQSNYYAAFVLTEYFAYLHRVSNPKTNVPSGCRTARNERLRERASETQYAASATVSGWFLLSLFAAISRFKLRSWRDSSNSRPVCPPPANTSDRK